MRLKKQKQKNAMAERTRPAQRTVKIQRTTADGRTLTQNIHLSKWEAGRQRNGPGNAFENAGWQLVPEKTAPKPEAVKPAPAKLPEA